MRILFFFFLLLLSLSGTLGDYEYLTLASQWLPSFCATKPCYQQYVKESRFTIHGLWPQGKLQNKSNTPFDLSKIQSTTVDNMKKDWPSVQKRNPNEKFWQHEWDDHGKWSENNFKLNAYFAKGLEVFNKINPMAVLTNAGIKPDKTKKYKAADVKKAIHGKTGHDPDLVCNKNSQLLEIRVCLDAHGNTYQDCKYPTGNCPADFLIPSP